LRNYYPILDRHNDALQIYLKKEGSDLILTDDGYTIRDLTLSGFELNTEKRKKLFDSILKGFGVKQENDELIVESNFENFPQKKHNFIQAILAINDLFILSSPNVESFFREDVERFLNLNLIRFIPSVKFTGKSGFDHYFDFVIPASRHNSERVIRTLNKATRQNITSLIFSWNDIKDVRTISSKMLVVLNDVDYKINPEYVSALKQYSLLPIEWSKREEYLPILLN
jgi:Domain of unknown function DUF1828./Domain of unknown function DUF1829.